MTTSSRDYAFPWPQSSCARLPSAQLRLFKLPLPWSSNFPHSTRLHGEAGLGAGASGAGFHLTIRQRPSCSGHLAACLRCASELAQAWVTPSLRAWNTPLRPAWATPSIPAWATSSAQTPAPKACRSLGLPSSVHHHSVHHHGEVSQVRKMSPWAPIFRAAHHAMAEWCSSWNAPEHPPVDGPWHTGSCPGRIATACGSSHAADSVDLVRHVLTFRPCVTWLNLPCTARLSVLHAAGSRASIGVGSCAEHSA